MPIKNKLVAGIGTNDANYNVTRNGRITCPFYREWKGMLDRIRDKASYRDCTVCDEWLDSFMAFRAWMVEQDWEGKELDKDLLGRDLKHYSPSTCYFIPGLLNRHISHILIPRSSNGKPGKYLCGVRPMGNRWEYKVVGHRNRETYATELLAHEAWCWAKASFLISKLYLCEGDDILMDHLRDFAEDLANGCFTIQAELDRAEARRVTSQNVEIEGNY